MNMRFSGHIGYLFALLLMSSCSWEKETKEKNTDMVVLRQDIASTVQLQGRLRFERESQLFSPGTGMVNQQAFHIGQQVETGELLLRLEHDSLMDGESDSSGERARHWLNVVYPAQLQALQGEKLQQRARHKLEDQQSSGRLDAMRRAQTDGIAMIEDVNEAESTRSQILLTHAAESAGWKSRLSQLMQQKIEMQNMQQQADHAIDKEKRAQRNTMLRAPFNGTITAISNIFQGGSDIQMSRGDYVLTVTSTTELAIAVTAPSQLLHMLPKAPPHCILTRNLKPIACRFLTVGRETGANADYTALYEVLPGNDASVGGSAEIELVLESRKAVLAVPKQALAAVNGQLGVYMRRSDRVQFAPVTTGLEGNNHVEILRGLNEGERLVMPN
jgi:multidrug efflux pump subunit AcrA (membrane-fusion protein)